MKIKSPGILLMLALLPAGILLAGCEESYKCSVGSPPKYFDVQGLSLAAVKPATGQAPATGETVAAADIRLEVTLQVNFYGYSPAPRSWFPAAYACPPTPVSGYQGTSETLDSLTVRSVYAYDATHPAGAVVNDLLRDEAAGTVLPTAPAPGTRPNMFGYRLLLLRAPAQPGPQQFVLRYRLASGETYTARTPVLTLR